MRYAELKEYIEKVPGRRGQTILVPVNPSPLAIKRLLEKSLHNEVRGIYSDGNFYFWDAALMIHLDMASQLGIKFHNMIELIVSTDKINPENIILTFRATPKYIPTDNEYLNKFFERVTRGELTHFVLKV